MNIRILLTGVAKAPQKGSSGAAGYDLAAINETYITPSSSGAGIVHTGVSVSIPKGYVGLIIERSSLHKRGLNLANNVGVIDSDYRGELVVALRNTADKTIVIKAGERVAQLLILASPEITFIPVEKLDETDRSDGAFGSTGI